jgi:hypothetical protein
MEHKADWTTQAGSALVRLANALAENDIFPSSPIVVFGSAPLQIFVHPDFLSADIDIFIREEDLEEPIAALIEELGLGKGKAAYYIEIVPSYIFRAGYDWRDRAQVEEVNGIRFMFPDTLDILMAKLRRLDEKDFRAFELVTKETGRPTEDEMLRELRSSYEVVYVKRDGSKSPVWTNAERLWPRLFGRPLDVRREVLQPVFDTLEAAGTKEDYLAELRVSLGLE